MSKHEQQTQSPGYDTAKVDEATLALLWLVRWDCAEDYGRAWKSFDWETMNRLHEQGMISDPVGKSKSVVLTVEGFKKSRELFHSLFVR